MYALLSLLLVAVVIADACDVGIVVIINKRDAILE